MLKPDTVIPSGPPKPHRLTLDAQTLTRLRGSIPVIPSVLISGCAAAPAAQRAPRAERGRRASLDAQTLTRLRGSIPVITLC